MPDNAATTAIDWSVTQQINLARVEAGSQAKVIGILQDLESEIIGILDSNKASIGKQKKLAEIQAAAAKAIQKSYATVQVGHSDDLKGVAKAAAKGTAKQVNAMIGVSVADPVISDKQLEKLADDTLVFGAKSGEWWAGQSAGLRDKFGKQMRMGYGLGESVEEITRRVRGTKANGYNDGIMGTSRREAKALVRSSIQTISNQARIESIEGMAPLAKGLRWTATLDGRTTDICKGLDGLEWRFPDMEPVGHGKQFPGPVAHWNCRSTQVPVTASWAELSGKKIPAIGDQELAAAVDKKLKDQGMDDLKRAQVKTRARASMDGQKPREMNYEGWLKTKDQAFINRALGPSRAALWQSGKLTLKDLTDQENRPLTVKALEAAIDADQLPDETEGVEFIPVDPKQFKRKVPPKADQATEHKADNGGTVPAAISQTEWENGLTAEQKDSIEYWSTDYYSVQDVRNAAKGQTPNNPLANTFIDTLKGAPTHKGAVYRGVAMHDDPLVKYKAGDDLTFLPFASTSKNRAVAEEFASYGMDEHKVVYRIESDEGVDISKFVLEGYEDQQEVILPGGKTYTIESLQTVQGDAEEYTLIRVKVKKAGEQASSNQVIDQVAQNTAKAQMDDIVANPKGQTLKAKAIKQLQKAEPNLTPVEMLAKAEGIALEKQAAASMASKLSTAKKKLLQGKAPSPSEQATIDSLEGDELTNWKQAVDDAKGQTDQAKVEKLTTELNETHWNGESLTNFMQANEADLKALSPEAKAKVTKQYVHLTNVESAQSWTGQVIAGSMEPSEAIAKLKEIKGFTTDQTTLTEIDLQVAIVQDHQATAQMGKISMTDDGLAALNKAKAIVPKDAPAVDLLNETIAQQANIQQAKQSAAHDELEKILAGDSTKLKLKALQTELKSYSTDFLIDVAPSEYPELLATVEKVAAEKQAAASKASNLSGAKKKILAGEQPTPAQQAVIDNLTPEEAANWKQNLSEAQGVADPMAELKAIADATDDETLLQMIDQIGGDPDIAAESDIGPKMGFLATAEALDDMGEDGISLQDTLAIAQKTLKDQAKAKAKLAKAVKPEPTATPEPADLYVPPLGELQKVKDLPGSTKPYLAKDPTTGNLYVVKSTAKGLTQAHLKSEATADAIYRAAGLNVPASTQPDSKTKVAQFLEGGETLQEWKQGKSKAQIDAMHAELRKGFVADALLANWDVAGASNDNILVVKGKPVRIDNGGALGFRAQGGKKDSFYDPTGKVPELESLRDPSQAPLVSQFTKGITKAEIEEQTISLLDRRDKLVDAAKKAGAPLKDIDALNRRLDWLADQLPAKPKKPTPRASKEAQAAIERSITPETPKLVKRAKINGQSIDIGTRHVEDTQALIWQETDLSGQPVTVVQLKVTDEGAQAVRKKMAPEFNQATTIAPSALTPGTHPDDDLSSTLINAAKTLAHHADDKGFNQGTLDQLANAGAKLAQLQASGDPAKVAMAKHYQPLWDKLMDVDKTATAAKIKKAVPMVQSWHFDPKKYEKEKKAAPAKDRKVEKITQYQERSNTFSKGEAKNQPGAAMTFSLSQGGYRVQVNDGTTVQYIDRAGSYSERNGLALEGMTTVRIPGEVTPAKLERAMQELADLGIDVTPPSDDYKEYLVARRTASLTRKHTLDSWKKIDAMTDERKRADAAREWVKKTYGTEMPKRGTKAHRQLIDGEANHDGSGWRKWDRLDMGENPREQLKDFRLVHNTGADVVTAVKGMLESGGEATATINRLQKGVPVTAGYSSQADVRTGGASYFFTRLRKKGTSSGKLVFKGDILARTDAVSYTGDKYGRISALNSRKWTIGDYANMGGTDETIFKNGIDLVRDIDTINSGSPAKRKEIIKAFKDAGYATLPDGRKIETVVK